MLQALILEERIARIEDPVKAGHLAEAMADLRIVIARARETVPSTSPSDEWIDSESEPILVGS